ncbi:MAG: Ribonuclease [uncultured Sulfurovum sp.]|uniref:Ribonuclease n=1 Tax=uncultured Sulfurovum sp. TaxID=269237 RepID=A0A6S6S913_9BACT|nr:MAG: Ribonuclease [uncultured Sulfurovum sp.]
MLSNIYVDTNIIIDICDLKRPSHMSSLKIIRDYAEDGCELYINSDSLATLFYILRNQAKLSFEEAIEKMYFVRDIFTLISIDDSIFYEALALCENNICTDYEDATQYICAKKVEADIIVTNDKGFISEDIELFSTMS